jgi:hypothetical protein
MSAPAPARVEWMKKPGHRFSTTWRSLAKHKARPMIQAILHRADHDANGRRTCCCRSFRNDTRCTGDHGKPAEGLTVAPLKLRCHKLETPRAALPLLSSRRHGLCGRRILRGTL